MSNEARELGNGIDYFAACSSCGRMPHSGHLPIPRDIKPGPRWTEPMLEMVDHIGAYATLLMIAAFGGRRIYIPADYTKGKRYEGIGTIADVIGEEAATKLSFVYRREFVLIPTGRGVLAQARPGPIIAAVRAGLMSGADAARILRTSRPYVSHLVHDTDEGLGIEPAPPHSTA